MGIMEQQMSSINNLLPGARKSNPYIPETGESCDCEDRQCLMMALRSVIFFWKVIELNKVRLSMYYSAPRFILLLEIPRLRVGFRQGNGFGSAPAMLQP